MVRQSVELLKKRVEHYTFVSSISVYADFSQVDMVERAKVATVDDAMIESISEHYGALKALCEREIRPGLIVGPHDPTDRFTYWVRRFSQGGEVLVPGRRDYPVQFIDARDLAEWTVRMVEHKVCGVFNATGPEAELSMETFVRVLEEVYHTRKGVVIMFYHLVNEDIQLKLLELRDAAEIFALIDASRLHLREWLPWVDATTTVEDPKTFIQSTLQQFVANTGFQAGILYKGEFVGMIG